MTNTIPSISSLLHACFPGRVKQDEPLAAHSSARVGGPADFFLELDTTDECEQLVRLCAQYRLPLLIIGNGSNILFTDQGVRGIVARMGARTSHLDEQQQMAVVDAGVSWPDLVEEMARHGWGGLAFGAGIPGTLGGSIVTNAGFHNEEIGQHVQWVEVLDARGCNVAEEGTFAFPQLRRYTQADLQLGNRKSRFREQRRAQITPSGQLVPVPRAQITPPEIILRLGVRMQQEDTQHIAQRWRKNQAASMGHINEFAGHVGPLFKDPPGRKASQVIERTAMDEWKKGAVHISAHNANFLVNQGGAQAADIAQMIVAIHHQVLVQTGIDLEVDIEVYGV